MVDLTWSFFAVAAPAVIFVGISKGGFGSGAAFAAATILALIVDPRAALGIMLPLLMLIGVASLKTYWGAGVGRMRGCCFWGVCRGRCWA